MHLKSKVGAILWTQPIFFYILIIFTHVWCMHDILQLGRRSSTADETVPAPEVKVDKEVVTSPTRSPEIVIINKETGDSAANSPRSPVSHNTADVTTKPVISQVT